MMNKTAPVVEGKFISEEKQSHLRCILCGSKNVWYREWDSDDNVYNDYHYHCKVCGEVWWVARGGV